MRGAAELFRRFAQRSAWKEMFVTKRCLLVNEDEIKAPVQTYVLEAVVKEKQIAAKFRDGMATAADAVLVDHDRDATEIFRQHEWLVAGSFGI